MSRRLALVSVLQLALCGGAYAQPVISSSKPTFDCAKIKTPLAQILCSSSDGALADWDLSASAWAYAASLDDEGRKTFWNELDWWFALLNVSCRLTPALSHTQLQCVTDAYHRRAKSLRSKMSADALAEVALTPEQRAAIQGQLVSLSFLKGQIDGEFGLNTRQAINAFQQSNGHAVANYLTEDERRTLLSPSGTITTNAPPSSTTIQTAPPSTTIETAPSQTQSDDAGKAIAAAGAARRPAEEEAQGKSAEIEAAYRAADDAASRAATAEAARRYAEEEMQRKATEAAAAEEKAAEFKERLEQQLKQKSLLLIAIASLIILLVSVCAVLIAKLKGKATNNFRSAK